MIRSLHRWPALLALFLTLALTLSGAALSIFPVAQSFATPSINAELKIGELASRIQSVYPGVEQIRRAPSGRITAHWFANGTTGTAIIDPKTGRGIASADSNEIERWLTRFHRSLLLGDGGRVAMAIGAFAMLVISLSGIVLLARRAGGWRHILAPPKGSPAVRLHVEISRISVLGLVLSSITALWMAAETFDLLTIESDQTVFQAVVSGKSDVALDDIELLSQVSVAELRELSFPYPGDTSDVFTLSTATGIGYLDQGNGALLGWTNLTTWKRFSETMYMLHTGQGASVLGLVLGVMALGVPLMGVTGVLLWAAGRRNSPRVRNNKSVRQAETILLVGSEGGTTWGFAATLHQALTKAGQSVHTESMSAFRPADYAKAQTLIILAATYGDGDAPASAKGFLDRMERLPSMLDVKLAVLGFGDGTFPNFCGFAKKISETVKEKNGQELVAFGTVDRQSRLEFGCWAQTLGAAMGIDLEVSHQPNRPKSQPLTLVSRRDYGAEVQASTAILRFSQPKVPIWHRLLFRGNDRFQAGDLLGVLPEASDLPRFYSLASGHSDGFVEVVVRMLPDGLCSGQLMALQPGDTITAFFRSNPDFQIDSKSEPLILIGAGSGIAPFAGFVRGNEGLRPIHLFFGLRHLDSDFLYSEDLLDWHAIGYVKRIVTAVSREAKPRYVQDALRAEASHVARLVRDGAQIMVCGGRDMAADVTDALTDILAPIGLTPRALKAEGRYVEDVY